MEITCCLHCGGPIAKMSEQEYRDRFPGNGLAGQPPRQADPAAPLCGRCGVTRVNRRRNGSCFPTCYECN